MYGEGKLSAPRLDGCGDFIGEKTHLRGHQPSEWHRSVDAAVLAHGPTQQHFDQLADAQAAAMRRPSA